MNSTWKEILNNLSKTEPKTPTPNDRVLVIDSMNTFFRCFSVINHVNPEGTHIGGLTGYLKSIGYLVRLLKPTKVILVFDGQGSTTNKRYLYPEYKANRNIQKIQNWVNFKTKEEESDAMNNQLTRLVDYLQTLPVHLLSIDKIEADDTIGYLSQNINGEVTIMSTDRDFLQLVSKNVTVYNPTKKLFYTPKRVFDEYGVHPQNYIIYKTYLGDKGDNIPKIKGFGKDKLFKLLPQIKEETKLNLQESLGMMDKNHGQWSKKILNFKNQLEINLKLMDLSNPSILDSDKEIIDNTINTSNTNLDINTFKLLYAKDKLGDSIPNLDNWLDTFKHLTLK